METTSDRFSLIPFFSVHLISDSFVFFGGFFFFFFFYHIGKLALANKSEKRMFWTYHHMDSKTAPTSGRKRILVIVLNWAYMFSLNISHKLLCLIKLDTSS